MKNFLNRTSWRKLMSITCLSYGTLLLIERFWWFWPSALSHQIATGIFAIYLAVCVFLYFRTKNHNVIEKLTVVLCIFTVINLLISTFWTWWYPPELNWRMTVMGLFTLFLGLMLKEEKKVIIGNLSSY